MRGYRRRRRIGRTGKNTGLGWNGKLILTVLLCGFLLFLAAIVLGNYLRTLTPAADDESTDFSESTEAPEAEDSSLIITGMGVTFDSVLKSSGTTSAAPADSTGTDDTGTLPVSGITYDSLSILLRYPVADASETDSEQTGTDTAESTSAAASTYTKNSMKMLYTSPIVIATDLDTPGDVSLRDGITSLRLLTGIKYISAVFYISYPSYSGSLSEEIREYEMALLYELFEYGVSEVVICGYGSEDADIEEAARFTKELKARSGDKCVVGIALPFEFYSQSASYAKMREEDLGDAFFAMDLVSVSVPALMTPEDVVYDRVRRTISLAVAYSVRVVVGCGSPADCSGQVEAAVRGGASNVQGIIVD